MYTYGFQRAETLGALANGIFLVALCVTIFLDAVQRFFEPQEVSHPLWVLIVGCCGLTFNILGLFLFHEHSHDHGGGEHGHAHKSDEHAAEEGHSHSNAATAGDADTHALADESGNVADVLPQERVGGWPKTQRTDEDSDKTLSKQVSPTKKRKHNRSRSRGFSTVDDIPIHPGSFRNNIIAASRFEEAESGSATDTEEAVDEDGTPPSEESPLIPRNKDKRISRVSSNGWHKDHKHNKPKESQGSGGHSHSHDLNMRGMFLHVVGDALGNVGVIVSALIIWLTTFPGRYYFDPAISLFITIIILGSAIPLCKAASRILLQGVPAHIDVDEIREDIEDLPGIISCHHLHVWQLSYTKLIASLHVQVGYDFKGEGSKRYMDLARAIRKCLHEYGIHSSTIQPEFCLDETHAHLSNAPEDSDDGHGHSHEHNGRPKGSKQPSKTGSLRSANPDACLLECGDDCAGAQQCCAPSTVDTTAGHDHDHDGHAH